MIHMGYAPYYSRFFKGYLDKRKDNLNIVEFGIFKGTGLAILSDCFPNSNLYGFDINLDNFKENKDFLVYQGAFKKNKIEIYECDQLNITNQWLQNKVQNIKFDIVIDDGFHSIEAIKNTATSIKPLMKKEIYILLRTIFLLRKV